MEEIKKLLESMQQEIRQQKTDMLEMKEDIKNTITNNINEKFNCLESKNEILEKKIQEQSQKINNLERHIRRKNLIIFGVKEEENSYQELEQLILKIINTFFNTLYDSNNIEAVRRIGVKGQKIRPVVITFSTIGLKLKIQKNKKCLLNTPYYIKKDYPLTVLNKRKELQTQLKKEKALGKTAFIKYDKLIVIDNKNFNSDNRNNKRNLSQSPEITYINEQVDKQNKKQPHKTNKSANIKDFILQKKLKFSTHSDNYSDQTKNTQQDKI